MLYCFVLIITNYLSLTISDLIIHHLIQKNKFFPHIALKSFIINSPSQSVCAVESENQFYQSSTHKQQRYKLLQASKKEKRYCSRSSSKTAVPHDEILSSEKYFLFCVSNIEEVKNEEADRTRWYSITKNYITESLERVHECVL